MVSRFDWRQDAHDVASILYQNVITQEERKELGEYYTPSWLADAITETVWDDPASQRILDSSCGSGTFIGSAVRRLLSATTGETASKRLTLLQDNIRGIDIHPVAVQLAKATWVMASTETISAARNESPHAITSITAPIYLGDSLQLRYDTGNLEAEQFLQLNTGEILDESSEEIVFNIPKSLARRHSEFDRVVAELAYAIDHGHDAYASLRNMELDDSERLAMETVVANMVQLHHMGRNHVWAYYIRNMTRPAMISENKVDRIVGNPPWLKYADSSDIIRKELRTMSEHRYQIWAGGRQAPHQEVATLFYIRVAELYLRTGGRMGMVMPLSVLRLELHRKFRSGKYARRRRGRSRVPIPSWNFDFRADVPWDLDGLDPQPFDTMPSSVVFATFKGQDDGVESNRALAPGTVQMWRGATNTENVTKPLEALHHDDGTFYSPYAQLSRQGPTIVDRRLLFVEELVNNAPLALPTTTNTTVRRGRQDNIRYEEPQYENDMQNLDNLPVHQNHLFNIYMGECLAPYVTLGTWRAALPVLRDIMVMPMNHEDCPANEDGEISHIACRLDVDTLDQTMSWRWNIVADIYRRQHANQRISDLLDRLDYQHQLTSQLAYCRTLIDSEADEQLAFQQRPVRVAYTTSGQPTAAIIDDHHAILDSGLYQVSCVNRAEAHYVIAILNSNKLYREVEPFMPRGQFGGPRHLHKHCWKLPVPRYDSNDPLHSNLSLLGQVAASVCQSLVRPTIDANYNSGRRSDMARSLLRHQWQPNSPIAQTIERRVSELLNVRQREEFQEN